jgi:signal transduction histidine kinase
MRHADEGLIGREVLVNAFRHAHAKQIEAEIRYDEKLLRLRIRDDGIGMDKKLLTQGSREGHWGLPGIRERGKRIKAELGIWSEPGAGTEGDAGAGAVVGRHPGDLERAG